MFGIAALFGKHLGEESELTRVQIFRYNSVCVRAVLLLTAAQEEQPPVWGSRQRATLVSTVALASTLQRRGDGISLKSNLP